MAASVVHPVVELRKQASAFESALAACLADPNPKAIHQFRTSSRRLEAVLSVVTSLKGLPSLGRKAVKLRRRLRKPRQAAGRVRDLDVQQALLAEHLPADAVYSTPINEAGARLTQILIRRRRKAASRLTDVLNSRHLKLTTTLHRLLVELTPACDVTISTLSLLQGAMQSFEAEHAVGMSDPSARQLHSIRKAAKAARYVMELGATPTAKKTAARFELLQQAGGLWHDWHNFTATVTTAVGEDHPVAGAFSHLSDRQLERFKMALAEFRRGL